MKARLLQTGVDALSEPRFPGRNENRSGLTRPRVGERCQPALVPSVSLSLTVVESLNEEKVESYRSPERAWSFPNEANKSGWRERLEKTTTHSQTCLGSYLLTGLWRQLPRNSRTSAWLRSVQKTKQNEIPSTIDKKNVSLHPAVCLIVEVSCNPAIRYLRFQRSYCNLNKLLYLFIQNLVQETVQKYGF